MTRKSIEENLKRDMQKNIPDKNALWQKIEANLPEQPVSQPVKRTIRMTAGTKFLTIAACFLLVIAGVQLVRPRLATQMENTPASDSASSTADAEIYDNDNAADAAPDDADAEIREEKKLVSYQDLNISHEKTIASQVNLSLLGTNDQLFEENAILAKTEFFLDVKVLEGMQNDSGTMHYTLEILDVYGGELSQETITLETNSAYLLEQNHEYVIPVYVQNQNYALSCECAPQIEKTYDNQLIIPNGWHTLMQGETTPVLYDSYGIDDYFYDRMYLTGDLNLELLLQKWESL